MKKEERDMKLRKLEEKDALYMLEWMHDDELVRHMHKNFSSMTLEHCLDFIKNSAKSKADVHFAIVDETDDYLGTVSLKNIHDMHAEFGIVVRRVAMGSGVATYGMKRILQYAFDELDLEFVFWCVDKNNLRALSFYDKNQYSRIDYSELNVTVPYDEEKANRFVWYKCEDVKN